MKEQRIELGQLIRYYYGDQLTIDINMETMATSHIVDSAEVDDLINSHRINTNGWRENAPGFIRCQLVSKVAKWHI